MDIEEIPIFMGPQASFQYVVILNDEKILVFESTTKLAYFYGSLRKVPNNTVRKQMAIKGVPSFLEFAKTHPVLKNVKNWDAIFGLLH